MLQFTEQEIQKLKDYLNIQPKSWDNEIRLLKKAQSYIWLFKLCPGIQMVAIWNSIAMNHAHRKSDIDLFIVTEKKRMWYVRIFLTFVFFILWERKTQKSHAGRFCLSFFMTDEDLSLENIALEKDIYIYWRILTLKPIIDNHSTYEKFIVTNSKWCNFSWYDDIIKENKKFITYTWWTWGTNWKFLDMKNWGYKKIFLWKTLRSYERLWKPEWVIINEHMLKFHDQDKRKKIRDILLK